MNEKTLQVLDYFKVLERLAEYCSFPVSVEKGKALRPTNDIYDARRRLLETSEAVNLLESNINITIGGARDVREAVDLASHGGVLDPADILDIKYTLVSSRTLARTFERLADQYPHMADIATQLPPPLGIIDAATRAISDRGDILDSASKKLSDIRRDLRIVHDRLLSKLQKMVTNSKVNQFLQESLVTLRDGRYVLPLRSEFKGRIKSIVHDQSASGATLFVEPLGVVEMNNQHRELQLSERDEERRILAEISGLIGQHANEILHTVEIIAEIDWVLARGKYAQDLNAIEPKLHPIPDRKTLNSNRSYNGIQPEIDKIPETNHPGTVIKFYQGRHPLLDPTSLAMGVTEVVPIDVELDDQTYALVITGPNTGGKTVTLKTVGLLALMAQSGLHIPAMPGAEISVFSQIFADIGDEQSIEQSLSTFSGHINNIIQILENANQRSLVILDELGAGTDPQEGAALARAILVHFLERGVTTLVTTHHPELKAFAYAVPGATNASMEFDLDTLRPTFQLSIGLPGRSNALAIAERLGLPTSIISEARRELSPDEMRAEDLLAEIHRQRELSQKARKATELARKNAEVLRAELIERLEEIELERRKIIEEARTEAENQIRKLEEEIENVRKTLSRAHQPVDSLLSIEEKIHEMEEDFTRPVERHELDIIHNLIDFPEHEKRNICLGDNVRLRSLGAQGIITAMTESEAEVQVGVLRVRTRMDELELVGYAEQSKKDDTLTKENQLTQVISGAVPAKAGLFDSPGIELDLRGKRSDEAETALENYLDAAFMARLPFVRVIHGKGTGKLRQAVRQALNGHPHVRSFETGGEKEGGEGVTIIKLVES